MTEPALDNHEPMYSYGARFNFQTPPPEFAQSAVEPLSPQLRPVMSAKDTPPTGTGSRTNFYHMNVEQRTGSNDTVYSGSSSSFAAPNYIASSHTTNLPPVSQSYYAMPPTLAAFADIALSTAPSSFNKQSISPSVSYNNRILSPPIMQATSSMLSNGFHPTPQPSYGYLDSRQSSYSDTIVVKSTPTVMASGSVSPMNSPRLPPIAVFSTSGLPTSRDESAAPVFPRAASFGLENPTGSASYSPVFSLPPISDLTSPDALKNTPILIADGDQGPDRVTADKRWRRGDGGEPAGPSSEEAIFKTPRGGRSGTRGRGRGKQGAAASPRRQTRSQRIPVQDHSDIVENSSPKRSVEDSAPPTASDLDPTPSAPANRDASAIVDTAAAIDINAPLSPSPAYSPYPSRQPTPSLEASSGPVSISTATDIADGGWPAGSAWNAPADGMPDDQVQTEAVSPEKPAIDGSHAALVGGSVEVMPGVPQAASKELASDECASRSTAVTPPPDEAAVGRSRGNVPKPFGTTGNVEAEAVVPPQSQVNDIELPSETNIEDAIVVKFTAKVDDPVKLVEKVLSAAPETIGREQAGDSTQDPTEAPISMISNQAKSPESGPMGEIEGKVIESGETLMAQDGDVDMIGAGGVAAVDQPVFDKTPEKDESPNNEQSHTSKSARCEPHGRDDVGEKLDAHDIPDSNAHVELVTGCLDQGDTKGDTNRINENEDVDMEGDFDIQEGVGNEPIFGANDPVANGIPMQVIDGLSEMDDEVTADVSTESYLPGNYSKVTATNQSESTQISEELPREPESHKDESCATCKVRYWDEDGTRMDSSSWIGCDGCGSWHHAHCVELDSTAVHKIDKFYCRDCVPKFGPSTLKRTSGRAHTAIDYNALHNGSSVPIRNPTDPKVHPYVIKLHEEKHLFAEDQFARIAPEYVTADLLNTMPNGWTDPFVVPAGLNPAPWGPNPPKLSRPPNPDPTISENVEGSTPPPPPPPEDTAKSRRKAKGPEELTLDNGNFDPQEVDRIKKIFLEGEYDLEVRREGADALDMILPIGLTIRKVAEILGPEWGIDMIDVLGQVTRKEDKWRFERLVEYFESSIRENIYNCISCEVSNSRLGKLISIPRAVRDLDLSDQVWPKEVEKSRVQKYLLVSVKDCWTDFHVDFAGSSVFYHIYQGQKQFLVMPPTPENLDIYEKWHYNPEMSTTWLPDLINDPCTLVTLNRGDTLFIPSGWIHAVYTPQDSIVIGGNFLTRQHYVKQTMVQRIEVVTGVGLSQRYPNYTTLIWYLAKYYMEKDPIPANLDYALCKGRILKKSEKQKDDRKTKEELMKEPHYTVHELEGLPSICNFLLRTVLIDLGATTTTLRGNKPLTAASITAVRKAIIPEYREDSLKAIKEFGRWCVWKRAFHDIVPGGEQLPEWAFPNWFPADIQRKEPSESALRRKERRLADQARRAEPPRRPGLRVRTRRSTTGTYTESASPGPEPAPEPAPEPTPSAIATATASVTPTITLPRRGRPPGSANVPKKRVAVEATPEASKKKARLSKGIADADEEEESLDSGRSGRRKSKSKSDEKEEEGEPIRLPSGVIYMRKQSNLGPARSGCVTCRKAKTGCKHKAEIAAALAALSAGAKLVNGHVIDGTGSVEKAMNSGDNLHKRKQDGKTFESSDDDEEDEDDFLDEEDFVRRPLSKRRKSNTPSGVKKISGHDEEEEEEEEEYVPYIRPPSAPRVKSNTPARRQDAKNDQKNEYTLQLNDIRSPPVPKKTSSTPGSKKKGSPLNGSNIANLRPPPGMKGKKPSCDACKAAKIKCGHPTWHLAISKQAAKEQKMAEAAAGSVLRKQARGAKRAENEACRALKKRARKEDARRNYELVAGSEGEGPIGFEEEAAAPVIEHDDVTMPAVETDAIVEGAYSAERKAVVEDTLPTVDETSVSTKDNLPKENGANSNDRTSAPLDLDLSILDEYPAYIAVRSSTAPSDPSILAPPVDIDDEPEITTPSAPDTAESSSVVTNGTADSSSSSPRPRHDSQSQSTTDYSRLRKPRVTYSKATRTLKNKPDGSGSDAATNTRVPRNTTSTSPARTKTSGDTGVWEENEDMTKQDLIRLGTAADFGLRKRRPS